MTQNSNRLQSDIEPMVSTSTLTVEYWRGRLARQIKHADTSLIELATQMAKQDPYYAGAVGYMRLQNATNNRAGLTATAKAVTVLVNLNGEAPSTTDIKNRLNLTTK